MGNHGSWGDGEERRYPTTPLTGRGKRGMRPFFLPTEQIKDGSNYYVPSTSPPTGLNQTFSLAERGDKDPTAPVGPHSCSCSSLSRSPVKYAFTSLTLRRALQVYTFSSHLPTSSSAPHHHPQAVKPTAKQGSRVLWDFLLLLLFSQL